MIICSCNVLSDRAVKACAGPGPDCPRTPAEVYRCLGCSPQCGRCAPTIRAILSECRDTATGADSQACTKGCCQAPPVFDRSPWTRSADATAHPV